MEYQISPRLLLRGEAENRGRFCAKFQVWARQFELTDLESMCALLYHIYKDDLDGLPQYGITPQELTKNAREGFQKLRQYKESIINL